MKPESPLTFSYSRRRGPYFRAIAPFVILLALEGGLFVTLILLFVRAPGLRFGLAGGLLGLLGFAFLAVLLRPLWTPHLLTPSVLRLRRGGGWLEVPRDWIVAALPVEERVASVSIGLRYELRGKRIDAAFSDVGLVLLDLGEPRILRGSVRGLGPVREVRLNADDRAALLAALACTRVGAPLVKSEEGDPARPAAIRLAPRPADGEAAIEVLGLTRRFGSKVAVDRLDLRVGYGEVYGFLGPNGAGKTTAIKMLVGLLEPEAGSARLGGADVWREPLRAKAAFGYVPDRAHLYDGLTGREFLELLAQFRALPLGEAEARIDELLALVQLEEAAETLCRTYSFGMKRKLALAGALLHRPRVLVLDEPFNGLDPRAARRLKDLLVRLAGEGCGVILSTHDLATAEAVCTRLGVLHRGRLVAEGRSASELRERQGDGEAAQDLEALFLQLTEEEGAGPGERAEARGSAA